MANTGGACGLKDASADEIRAMPEVRKRVDGVREHRKKSKRQTTQQLAESPTLFGEIRQPDSRYLLIPSVSSETRRYIPMAFMPKTVIGSNLVLFVPARNASTISAFCRRRCTWPGCGRSADDWK